MRPLEAAEIQQDLLTRESTLLLDTTQLAIRSVIQMVLAYRFPLKLPTELWLNIITQYRKCTMHNYMAVRPTSLSITARGRVLRSRAVEADVNPLTGKGTALDGEFFLNRLHASNKDSIQHYPYVAEGTDRTYAIEFPNISFTNTSTTSALRVPNCLFTAITLEDVLGWLEKGGCWVCRGTRDICPGCVGVDQRLDMWISPGVNFACPLCLGLDFVQEDKAFLEKYRHDEPPAEEKKRRDARVSARLAELE